MESYIPILPTCYTILNIHILLWTEFYVPTYPYSLYVYQKAVYLIIYAYVIICNKV